uniref:Variant surface glycoprotein 1125.1543 n=1 Tax=Trypanosoma brucei TaxID=5691 RepID=A0A1J0R7J2_9TRYP|nr:variant surface glycoprotein 1125.1543 [Trypanosoma brucei]
MFSEHMKLKILTALLMVVSANATHHEMKANVWEAQCELATQLRKTPGQAKAKLINLIESLKNLNMMKLKLQVYAAANPRSEYKDAAAVLAAQANKLLTANLNIAAGTIDTALRATAITADIAAALATPITTIASAAGRSNYCLNSKAGSGAANNGRNEIGPVGCRELELDTLENTNGMDAEAINGEGFPKHPAVSGTDRQGQASQCGTLTSTANPTNAAGIKIAGGADIFKMGYGTISVVADDQPNTPDLTNLKQAGSYGTVNIFKRAHKVSLELRQIRQPKKRKKEKIY